MNKLLVLFLPFLFWSTAGALTTSPSSNLTPEAKLREPVKNRLEIRQEKQETLKLKLQTVRDEKKKVLVTRLDEKITATNQRRTTEMTNSLTKLSAILDKLSSRVADIKTKGKDTATMETAISEARTAIQTAQTAVQAQATKDYTVEITKETALRADVGKTISQMQADLKETHKTVVAAKQTVMKVFSVLKETGL